MVDSAGRRLVVAVDMLARVFSALADPTRRDLLARLAVADATVGELPARYDRSLPAYGRERYRLLDDVLAVLPPDAASAPPNRTETP
jgi:DNA-binding transcriptional ArsR family regulator